MQIDNIILEGSSVSDSLLITSMDDNVRIPDNELTQLIELAEVVDDLYEFDTMAKWTENSKINTYYMLWLRQRLISPYSIISFC